ncbi:PucR family transcriptional regulator [Streptomyces lydicus]|uniref:PucR family transcriptional regulator n=1 Tax=Streptomyces lydicus TaxID=47763 RepID=UPI0036EA9CD7
MNAISVADLVGALRHDVIQVKAFGNPTQAIRGVELLDCPETEGPAGTGQLLLGVGLDVAHEAAADHALRAAADSASVLAVKCAGQPPDDFLDRARTADVTIICVAPMVAWGRLQRFASTLLATWCGGIEGAPDTVLGGSDLFSLANSVAALVGGAVAVMDTSQTILAYSNLPDQPIDETRRRGILDRRVPLEAIPDHLAEAVWHSESVVRHRRENDMPRLAIVIRAGEDVLGSLWVVFSDDESIPDCEADLRRAAGVAALHMLALRRQVDADQDSRNHALRTALEQPGQEGMGLPLPAVLLVIAHTVATDDNPTASRRSDLLRMLDLFSLDSRSLGHRPSLALVNDRIYALLPTVPRGAVPLTALVQHVRDRAARTLHVSFSTVSAERIDTLSALTHARSDIDSALDHLRASGEKPGSYTTDQLRAELVRQRLLRAVQGDPLLRSGIGDRIFAYDRDHATEFRATLLTYLRHFGDVGTASSALMIHPNTLRQRLRRAQELFDVFLDSAAHRLMLEIELAAAPTPRT